MRVVFNLDSAGDMLKKRGLEPGGKIQKRFTAECVRSMNPYIPIMSDTLRRVKSIADDSVTYLSPYARYQYYGMLMVSSVSGSSWARHGEKKVLTSTKLNYHGGEKSGPFWDKRMWADQGTRIVNNIAAAAGGKAE